MDRICKFCKTTIAQSQIFGDTAICPACGQASITQSQPSNSFKYILAATALITVAAIGYSQKDDILLAISPRFALKTMDAGQLGTLEQSCLRTDNHDCLLGVYERMLELDPQDISAKANKAFQLTDLKRYKEADPIYKDILGSGTGTYDLMAFYADNLVALSQPKEAIKWYEKSLELKPTLVDITQKLARLYTQDKRPTEAISLLQSFAYKFPETKGALAGDMSANLELVDQQPKETSTLTFIGLSQGHFAVPIKIANSNKYEVYLVDTGASYVIMPTSDIDRDFPAAKASAQTAIAEIANGAPLEIHRVKVPKLKLAGWEFTDVEVAYCDSCARLAGMSLLKQVRMATVANGELSTLTLSR